jgi:hypothetical protein
MNCLNLVHIPRVFKLMTLLTLSLVRLTRFYHPLTYFILDSPSRTSRHATATEKNQARASALGHFPMPHLQGPSNGAFLVGDLATSAQPPWQQTLSLVARTVRQKHQLTSDEMEFIASTIDTNFEAITAFVPSWSSQIFLDASTESAGEKGHDVHRPVCFICLQVYSSKQRLRCELHVTKFRLCLIHASPHSSPLLSLRNQEGFVRCLPYTI